MKYSKKINTSFIADKIEDEKDKRSKNIYYFTLSMSTDQEHAFNKALKELINSINELSETGYNRV